MILQGTWHRNKQCDELFFFPRNCKQRKFLELLWELKGRLGLGKFDEQRKKWCMREKGKWWAELYLHSFNVPVMMRTTKPNACMCVSVLVMRDRWQFCRDMPGQPEKLMSKPGSYRPVWSTVAAWTYQIGNTCPLFVEGEECVILTFPEYFEICIESIFSVTFLVSSQVSSYQTAMASDLALNNNSWGKKTMKNKLTKNCETSFCSSVKWK